MDEWSTSPAHLKLKHTHVHKGHFLNPQCRWTGVQAIAWWLCEPHPAANNHLAYSIYSSATLRFANGRGHMTWLGHPSLEPLTLFCLLPSPSCQPCPTPTPFISKGNWKWPTKCLCDLTKASVISPEKGLAVPAVLAGAEDYYMLPSSQLTTSPTGRQAGAGWLVGWRNQTRLILEKLKYSNGSRLWTRLSP